MACPCLRRVGRCVADQAQPFGPVPRAVWERQPSELPGHPGLGAWGAPEPGRAGLDRDDPARRASRACAQRPLPVGARELLWRRSGFARAGGAACLRLALLLPRPIPAAALSRNRIRRHGRGARCHRGLGRCTARRRSRWRDAAWRTAQHARAGRGGARRGAGSRQSLAGA